jgi:hypothetical protein
MREIRISKVVRYDREFTPKSRFEPDRDTLALYHMDEGQGDVLGDSSANGYHGKIKGATWVPADRTPRLPEFVLQFSRGDTVEFPKLEETTGEFTLEGWFIAEPDMTSGNLIHLTHQVGLGYNGSFRFWFVGIYHRFGLLKGGISANGHRASVWTHVAATCQNNRVAIFVNGLPQKLAIQGKEWKPAEKEQLVIGGEKFHLMGNASKPSDPATRKLVATMREIRISKVVRYDKEFTPQKRFEPDKDTLALYHMDEGQGDVLRDSSGNNYHGRITGARWVQADGTPASPPTPGTSK